MTSKISIQSQGAELGSSHSSLFEDDVVPNKDDAQWFANAMNSVDSNLNMTDRFLNKVYEVSEDLKVKNENLNKNFKFGTASDDYTAMMQTLRDVSDYGFQTAIVTKVVSKATQAVEKLTNLN